MLTSQVTIGPQFFQGEVRNYSNLEAFYRELVQNSVDVGSSKIDIKISDLHDGTAKVVFTDNGPGMSKETLVDVFFTLGATTKVTSGTIGGFGKARILLCFAQDSYTIRTRNLLVTGSGASYTIDEHQPYFTGCQFDIIVAANNITHWFGYLFFESGAYNYLSKCQLTNVSVTINGTEFKNWLQKRSAVRQLSFGTVYTNKSNITYQHSILLRVNGALMSSKYLSANIMVIVEINPEKSREVLLSNRDSLVHEYELELDNFIQEISRDTLSALSKRQDSTKTIESGSARRFQSKKKKIEEVVYDDEIVAVGTGYVANVAYCDNSYSQTTYAFDYDPGAIATKPVDTIVSGMIHRIDTNDNVIRKAARLYHPKFISRRRKVLLRQWLIAVEYSLEALNDIDGIDDIEYRIGFCFGDALALHSIEADGSHALLFNPIDSQGKMSYSINGLVDHVKKIALAMHEVTHITRRHHDEAFATVQTTLTYTVMPQLSEIVKDMDECKV